MPCRTIVLPESNANGGQHWWQPGDNYITYTPPANATRVGLEFWWHQFSGDPAAAEGSLQTLVYLNDPQHGERRIFAAQNGADEYRTGKMVAFPMSIVVNPGEQFVVNVRNGNSVPHYIGLIVTILECTP